MHSPDKFLIHCHLTGFTRHTPLLYDHSHKSYIILLSKIITAGKKTRSFLIRYHLPAISIRRIASCRSQCFHVWKPLLKVSGSKPGFSIRCIINANHYPLRIITRIFINNIMILEHHYTHQSTYKSHSCKLDKQ